MSYTRTNWVTSETALSAANFNNIEDGIQEALQGVSDVNAALVTQVAALTSRLDLLAAKIQPVGSIWISTTSTDPATIFGGTWVRIEDTFLLAAGTNYAAGATGGEAAHTLTEAEIPAHMHKFLRQQWFSTDEEDNCGGLVNSIFSWHTSSGGSTSQGYVAGESMEAAYGSTGGGGAHNNMPPYLAVYVWKRTA